MMNNHQEFAGSLRIRNIMVAVPGFPRAWWMGTLQLLRFIRCLQMRVQQLHPGVKLGLDFRQFDLSLGLDLLVDGVVLGHLLLDLHLVRGGGLIGLRPRLQRQQLRVGRRRRWQAADARCPGRGSPRRDRRRTGRGSYAP